MSQAAFDLTQQHQWCLADLFGQICLVESDPDDLPHPEGVNAKVWSVEYAATNLGDDVIDTTKLWIEEAVEQAL